MPLLGRLFWFIISLHHCLFLFLWRQSSFHPCYEAKTEDMGLISWPCTFDLAPSSLATHLNMSMALDIWSSCCPLMHCHITCHLDVVSALAFRIIPSSICAVLNGNKLNLDNHNCHLWHDVTVWRWPGALVPPPPPPCPRHSAWAAWPWGPGLGWGNTPAARTGWQW